MAEFYSKTLEAAILSPGGGVRKPRGKWAAERRRRLEGIEPAFPGVTMILSVCTSIQSRFVPESKELRYQSRDNLATTPSSLPWRAIGHIKAATVRFEKIGWSRPWWSW